jgi:DNA polymerase III alpha subunit
MDRKTAETLATLSVRNTLLAHLDEAYANGKKVQANEASGQESLWGDEDDHEERNLKLDAEVIAGFTKLNKDYAKWEASSQQGPFERIDTSPQENRAFWEYHRRMARAGK